MQFIHKIFPATHFVISLAFVVCAVVILFLALLQLWEGIQPGAGLSINERFNAILESIALLTVAVAALELGQTILEEEVQRDTHISGPTRVRRFLSRFMVVLVVALSIETLVLAFRLSHEAPEQLPYVAGIGLTAAALLAGWGVFIRLNRSAEELEPEGMEQAKKEDQQVKK
jgi:preprotein translocase subunit SecG